MGLCCYDFIFHRDLLAAFLEILKDWRTMPGMFSNPLEQMSGSLPDIDPAAGGTTNVIHNKALQEQGSSAK